MGFKKYYLIFLFLGVLFLIRAYVFSFSVVRGESMIPFLENGDLVFVAKWPADYTPGQVVVIQMGGNRLWPWGSTKLVKRIVAKGNSEILIDDYKVYVNGEPYRESDAQPPRWDKDRYDCRFSSVYKTQKSEVFVLGDNRCESQDSRYIGAIEGHQLSGRVLFRLLPAKWNILNNFFNTLGKRD